MTGNDSAQSDDWTRHWENYADAAQRSPGATWRHRLVAKLLRKYLEPSNGANARVLDIGSGTGDMIALLRKHFPEASLLGVELSPTGTEIALQKVPDAAFVTSDLRHPTPELLARAAWATHAICAEVIEHVDDPAAFLREIRRYLATGATLILTVPGGPMSAYDKNLGHRRHYTEPALKALLETAGFRVLQISRPGFPFFNLYRLVLVLQGKSLINVLKQSNTGPSRWISALAMRVFSALFHANLSWIPLGWQIVATAQKNDGR